MAQRKNVPASTVRAWFNGLDTAPEGVPAPGSRGRLHPDTIAAFHKANPRQRYETGVAEARTIAVPKFDKRGRKTGKVEQVPAAEVRAALGIEGKRGRIAADSLVLVGQRRAGVQV